MIIIKISNILSINVFFLKFLHSVQGSDMQNSQNVFYKSISRKSRLHVCVQFSPVIHIFKDFRFKQSILNFSFFSPLTSKNLINLFLQKCKKYDLNKKKSIKDLNQMIKKKKKLKGISNYQSSLKTTTKKQSILGTELCKINI